MIKYYLYKLSDLIKLSESQKSLRKNDENKKT